MLTQKGKIEIDSLLKRGSRIPITANSDEVLLWCDALESGRYTRTRELLRMGDSMCCLGVACDISGLGWWWDNDFVTLDNDCEHNELPLIVAEWLGFTVRNPIILEGTSAIIMNDVLGLSFDQIAYLLRKAVELGKKQAKNG